MQVYLTLFLPLFFIVACVNESRLTETGSPGVATSYSGRTVAYRCGVDDSYLFSAKVDSSQAWLFLPDSTPVKVELSISASGARFVSGEYLYWSKGDEAMLETPEVSFTGCRIDHEEIPWEDAWIRGIDFRALGNEPGWYLELTRGEGIEYVLDYGTRTIYSQVPVPTTEETGETSYSIQTDRHTIDFELINEQCTSMSGKLFPISVQLTVDNRSYQGCGRWSRYLLLELDG